MKPIIPLLLTALFAAGCVNLKTRSDLRGQGDAEPQRQTVRQQREQAREYVEPKPVAAVARAEEYDEQMRALNGRIDAVENHLSQVNAAQAGEKQSVTEMAKYTDKKFLAYEEELKKLEARVAALSEEVARLRAPPAAAAAPKGKTSYDEAESLFEAKKWKEAIVNYQKYRDSNPKGKMYADATYKIGVCFQELKMKDEAKAFFDEVISKFPGSKEAKKAAFRSKSLK